jgi:hypothetical protein
MSTDAEALRRRVYEFASLTRYPLGKRLVVRVAGFFFWALIAAIGRTVRWVAVDTESIDAIHRAGQPFVGAFWHNRVVLATWFWRHRGIVVMTSQSFDGEYIARFIQRFGFGAARGSSRRGGQAALRLMAECLAHGMDAAFTIDGPTGPRYVAKRGAVQLAAISRKPIVPVGVAAERYWEVSSWDRFQVPRPFTRAVMLAGSPIRVDGEDDDALARAQAELQAALDALRVRTDGWWAPRVAARTSSAHASPADH